MVQKSESAVRPLLVSRQDAAIMLGNISVSTVCRLEEGGKLHAVKLGQSKNCASFYRLRDIEALVEERAASTKAKKSRTRYRPSLALVEGGVR